MDAEEFRRQGHRLVDWIAEYLTQMDARPVNPVVEPGSIKSKLPSVAPDRGEPFDALMKDFEDIIVPGLVHWNHPSFFAYFPANNSFPSILGELLASGLGVNGMNWATSPAATELEEKVLEWVRQAWGFPDHFTGSIQDTASTATLVSLLTAREKFLDDKGNLQGLGATGRRLVVYASREAHSSVEKAVKIAGFGKEYFRILGVDENLALDLDQLTASIEADLAQGLTPCAVVATIGTTSSTSVDPIRKIGEICKKYRLWFHVDMALAGSAALLPEMSHYFDGLELTDSFGFNPHKWLFTNFDCSLYFVADVPRLTRTFEILPEYLKTAQDKLVTNFRDWSIPLGRRFRALKLWFVLRTFGLDGLREKLRDHLTWARKLAEWVDAHPNFERLAPTPFQTVCFRLHPSGMDDEEELNRINAELVKAVNQDGRIYITQTKLGDRVTLRVSIGQTNTTLNHVQKGWELIQEKARELPAG